MATSNGSICAKIRTKMYRNLPHPNLLAGYRKKRNMYPNFPLPAPPIFLINKEFLI